MTRHTTTPTRAATTDGISPELVLALARQIPTLEADALARVLAANLPAWQPASSRP